jgi:guanylate kinase
MPAAPGTRVPQVARVFVITGPSGVGKGTLIRGLMECLPELRLSVSATTRQPRPGEEHGVDYYFLTPEEFERHMRDGDFVEHAQYAGRKYGTLHSELETPSSEPGTPQREVAAQVPDGPVVLEIEVQGARQLRESVPDAVQVFIAPPSLDALRVRLSGRGTDDPEEVERRLRVAEEELNAQPEFGHVVVNDRLEDALERLTVIVAGELD